MITIHKEGMSLWDKGPPSIELQNKEVDNIAVVEAKVTFPEKKKTVKKKGEQPKVTEKENKHDGDNELEYEVLNLKDEIINVLQFSDILGGSCDLPNRFLRHLAHETPGVCIPTT